MYLMQLGLFNVSLPHHSTLYFSLILAIFTNKIQILQIAENNCQLHKVIIGMQRMTKYYISYSKNVVPRCENVRQSDKTKGT